MAIFIITISFFGAAVSSGAKTISRSTRRQTQSIAPMPKSHIVLSKPAQAPAVVIPKDSDIPTLPAARRDRIISAEQRQQQMSKQGEDLLNSARGQLLSAWDQAELRTLIGRDLPEAGTLYADAVRGVSAPKMLAKADKEFDAQLRRIAEQIERADQVAQQLILDRQHTHGIFLEDKFRPSALDLSNRPDAS